MSGSLIGNLLCVASTFLVSQLSFNLKSLLLLRSSNLIHWHCVTVDRCRVKAIKMQVDSQAVEIYAGVSSIVVSSPRSRSRSPCGSQGACRPGIQDAWQSIIASLKDTVNRNPESTIEAKLLFTEIVREAIEGLRRMRS